MQVVNGVDDGSVIYFIACMVSAYTGCEMYGKEYSLFGF